MREAGLCSPCREGSTALLALPTFGSASQSQTAPRSNSPPTGKLLATQFTPMEVMKTDCWLKTYELLSLAQLWGSRHRTPLEDKKRKQEIFSYYKGKCSQQKQRKKALKKKTTINMESYFSSNLRLRDRFLRSSYRKYKTHEILKLI